MKFRQELEPSSSSCENNTKFDENLENDKNDKNLSRSKKFYENERFNAIEKKFKENNKKIEDAFGKEDLNCHM